MKTIRAIVVLVLGLALLSLYRALLDRAPFLVSFDKLARTIVSETWRALSAPTVFLAAILALVLLNYRKQLWPLLSGLQEVTLGNLSAKFATQRFAEGLEKTVAGALPENPTVPSISVAAKRDIIANFSEDLCLYFLQVANKPLPLEEHFRLISRGIFKRETAALAEMPDKPQITALYHGILRFEASGFLRALYQFPGLVARFKFETANGSLNLVARVDADALDLLRKRVGKEPDGGDSASGARGTT